MVNCQWNNIGSLSNDTTLVPTSLLMGQGLTWRSCSFKINSHPDGNFPCENPDGSARIDSDDIQITVNPLPTVAASSGVPTQDFCEPASGAFIIDLNDITPTATNAGLLAWSTNGSGSFSNPNILAPTYTPSNDDINNGTVILTITNNGLQGCDP